MEAFYVDRQTDNVLIALATWGLLRLAPMMIMIVVYL